MLVRAPFLWSYTELPRRKLVNHITPPHPQQRHLLWRPHSFSMTNFAVLNKIWTLAQQSLCLWTHKGKTKSWQAVLSSGGSEGMHICLLVSIVERVKFIHWKNDFFLAVSSGLAQPQKAGDITVFWPPFFLFTVNSIDCDPSCVLNLSQFSFFYNSTDLLNSARTRWL